MNRYLTIVCLALLCAGCPGGKSASIDWTKRPHQVRDAQYVPQPFGAWAIAPTTHTNFARVITYAGETAPDWIAPIAGPIAEQAIDAELAWSNAQGVPRARAASNANIEWWLYYNPTMVAKQTSAQARLPAKPPLLLAGDLQVQAEDGKAASSVPEPPGPNVNVSGQAQLKAHSGTITRCAVFINVSYYEIARRVYLRQGKSEAEARRLAVAYMAPHVPLISWHEGAHSLWGLNDDPASDALAGLMRYRWLAFPPAAYETDMILFVYPPGGAR
jgi:hypothetical protein